MKMHEGVKPKSRAGGLIVFLILFCISGCEKQEPLWKQGMPLKKENLRIGVIYHSDPIRETAGYSYTHEQGILDMQRTLGLEEGQIIRKINVIDSEPEMIESAMRSCIFAGAQLIIATSWGYMDTCEKLADKFPQVIFAHASGYKSNKVNFTHYFGHIYQARYLSGIVAGMKTQTGKIAYVAAMGRDNSEVTGGINAFALGVERVNPAARIFVRVTHSWFDPMAEQNAARELIASGCDVIAQHCDTSYPQIEAQRAGVWGIGYNTDMGRELPETVLGSVVWDWGVYYTALVQSIIDGSFNAAPHFGSIEDGMVDITPPAENIAAPGTAAIIAAERERLSSGDFDVFDGVLETNDGRKIGVPGVRPSDDEILYNMHWYYRTVIEALP